MEGESFYALVTADVENSSLSSTSTTSRGTVTKTIATGVAGSGTSSTTSSVTTLTATSDVSKDQAFAKEFVLTTWSGGGGTSDSSERRRDAATIVTFTSTEPLPGGSLSTSSEQHTSSSQSDVLTKTGRIDVDGQHHPLLAQTTHSETAHQNGTVEIDGSSTTPTRGGQESETIRQEGTNSGSRTLTVFGTASGHDPFRYHGSGSESAESQWVRTTSRDAAHDWSETTSEGSVGGGDFREKTIDSAGTQAASGLREASSSSLATFGIEAETGGVVLATRSNSSSESFSGQSQGNTTQGSFSEFDLSQSSTPAGPGGTPAAGGSAATKGQTGNGVTAPSATGSLNFGDSTFDLTTTSSQTIETTFSSQSSFDGQTTTASSDATSGATGYSVSTGSRSSKASQGRYEPTSFEFTETSNRVSLSQTASFDESTQSSSRDGVRSASGSQTAATQLERTDGVQTETAAAATFAEQTGRRSEWETASRTTNWSSTETEGTAHVLSPSGQGWTLTAGTESHSEDENWSGTLTGGYDFPAVPLPTGETLDKHGTTTGSSSGSSTHLRERHVDGEGNRTAPTGHRNDNKTTSETRVHNDEGTFEKAIDGEYGYLFTAEVERKGQRTETTSTSVTNERAYDNGELLSIEHETSRITTNRATVGEELVGSGSGSDERLPEAIAISLDSYFLERTETSSETIIR